MKLVTLSVYNYPHDLIVDKSKLEDEGIECFTKDELTVQVHNLLSNAVGGVKLQVMEQDYERARAVLATSNHLLVEDIQSKVKCPNCNSGNVDGIRFSGKLSMIFILIIGFPIPILSGKFKCYQCHHVFKLKK